MEKSRISYVRSSKLVRDLEKVGSPMFEVQSWIVVWKKVGSPMFEVQSWIVIWKKVGSPMFEVQS
ncbi:hypothetical protein JWG44_12830 [Leptospira sp. 201903071]|nr:hypothetical protein [Leptospira ainazelensis]